MLEINLKVNNKTIGRLHPETSIQRADFNRKDVRFANTNVWPCEDKCSN